MSTTKRSMRVVPRTVVTPAMVTYSNVSTAGDPAAYNPATSYSTGNQVTDPATALIYESRVNTNVGNTPATSPTQWLKIGSTNRMAMFDQRVSSRTTNANTIVQTFALGVAADSLIFKRLVAQSVTVQITDPVDGAQDPVTINLVSDGGIDDYWEYCFSPVLLDTGALFLDLPPYVNATITVTIDNTGGTAECGLCHVGMSFGAGASEWGLEKGIDDYSIKDTNQYGDAALVEGEYSEVMNFVVHVDRNYSSAFEQLLTSQRAQLAMYIGSDLFADTAVYGWPDTWRRIFKHLPRDVYTVSLKGAT